MRREEDLDLVRKVGDAALSELGDARADAVDERRHEARVVEELPHLVDLDVALVTGGLDGVREVFAVLAA